MPETLAVREFGASHPGADVRHQPRVHRRRAVPAAVGLQDPGDEVGDTTRLRADGVRVGLRGGVLRAARLRVLDGAGRTVLRSAVTSLRASRTVRLSLVRRLRGGARYTVVLTATDGAGRRVVRRAAVRVTR
ncbi:hypothetical protein GKE82_04575 [Conexibacter sp. W3-3-2]|uniref:hypothetical protein n=1 Tax=Conexibacter sp. W3-3-2 TaxID=2675227 RepID=UPI0012B88961|nr:hypothetical protein [Conexibacter sp. W3-3-2]MTD43595.1 hypothetical protein [Conexibacter sp. W3-3-2]